jgi:hypothetical protein
MKVEGRRYQERSPIPTRQRPTVRSASSELATAPGPLRSADADEYDAGREENEGRPPNGQTDADCQRADDQPAPCDSHSSTAVPEPSSTGVIRGPLDTRPLASWVRAARISGMAILAVRRLKGGGRDPFRAYRVLIYDQEVGRLKRGESARFPLSAGCHDLQVAVDWKRSARFEVSGDGDGTISFRCGPRRSAPALVDLFKRGDDTWLFLEPDAA